MVKTSEEPPTAFANWKHIRVFEFFIRFYSLPVESEFDPTLIFAIIFPFFFGLMVGDIGYGLVILLFSIWVVRKITHPETFSMMPKRISAFAVQILGKGPLLVLGKVLIPSSIIAIIAGVIFNNFFGFKLLPFTILDPITSYGIAKLLLISGYIGLAMVSFGFILGILNNIAHGDNHKAISSVGWLILAWGVAITGLNFLHKVSISLNPITGPLTALPVYMAILGLIIVIVFERGRGMIEVPSLISHILSYTRIVGILLASVILAFVVD
ncbi:V-type ATP synthase subunit I, partial [mine drainage metagenome]